MGKTATRGPYGDALTPAAENYGNNLLGVEPFPRFVGGAAAITLAASGNVHLSYFTPSAAATITKIELNAGGTPQTLASVARMGLYTVNAAGDGTLVARTANDTTIMASAFSYYSIALDATGGYVTAYTLTPGQRYAFGLIVVTAGVTGSAYGASGMGSATPQGTRPPVLCRLLAGQADLPASCLFSSTVTTNKPIWFGGIA